MIIPVKPPLTFTGPLASKEPIPPPVTFISLPSSTKPMPTLPPLIFNTVLKMSKKLPTLPPLIFTVLLAAEPKVPTVPPSMSRVAPIISKLKGRLPPSRSVNVCPGRRVDTGLGAEPDTTIGDKSAAGNATVVSWTLESESSELSEKINADPSESMPVRVSP